MSPLKININHCDSPMEIKLYTPRSILKEQETIQKVRSMAPIEANYSTKSMIVDLTYMG